MKYENYIGNLYTIYEKPKSKFTITYVEKPKSKFTITDVEKPRRKIKIYNI